MTTEAGFRSAMKEYRTVHIQEVAESLSYVTFIVSFTNLLLDLNHFITKPLATGR